MRKIGLDRFATIEVAIKNQWSMKCTVCADFKSQTPLDYKTINHRLWIGTFRRFKIECKLFLKLKIFKDREKQVMEYGPLFFGLLLLKLSQFMKNILLFKNSSSHLLLLLDTVDPFFSSSPTLSSLRQLDPNKNWVCNCGINFIYSTKIDKITPPTYPFS